MRVPAECAHFKAPERASVIFYCKKEPTCFRRCTPSQGVVLTNLLGLIPLMGTTGGDTISAELLEAARNAEAAEAHRNWAQMLASRVASGAAIKRRKPAAMNEGEEPEAPGTLTNRSCHFLGYRRIIKCKYLNCCQLTIHCHILFFFHAA